MELSFNSSFDVDAAFLSAVDKLENDFLQERPKPATSALQGIPANEGQHASNCGGIEAVHVSDGKNNCKLIQTNADQRPHVAVSATSSHCERSKLVKANNAILNCVKQPDLCNHKAEEQDGCKPVHTLSSKQPALLQNRTTTTVVHHGENYACDESKVVACKLFENVLELSEDERDHKNIPREATGTSVEHEEQGTSLVSRGNGQINSDGLNQHVHSDDRPDSMATRVDIGQKSQHVPQRQAVKSPENISTLSIDSRHTSCFDDSADQPSELQSSHIGAAPSGDGNDRLLLSSWGLPACILARYRQHGIASMFLWQADCLCTGQVLAGRNLVYSAPTSAGKTMVAELLLMKRVLETKQKAIFILPFVSVAREKMIYLQNLLQDAGVRVDGFIGASNPTGGFKHLDVAVCTIEKANSLVNRLIQEGNIEKLGLVIVDELHLVGDSHRGYLLELLLTKIRYVSLKARKDTASTALAAPSNPATQSPNRIQIIGMSATLPNLDLLARWLDADLYHTDFRPVPLTETFKIGRDFYNADMQKVRELAADLPTVAGDDDHLVALCLETLRAGRSVLVFCPTKNWCEKLAEMIARQFCCLSGNDGGASSNLGVTMKSESLLDVTEQLRRTPIGLDSVLGKVVPYAVAFHHAGLTFDERDVIEGSFRQQILRVLIATSTLSSGVNLPAQRVIIRTPMFYGTLLNSLVYKQMIGRAGRMGIDSFGEGVLICKANERSKAGQLLRAELPAVKSCLLTTPDNISSSMKRAILEVIASGLASTPADVNTYMQCTMLAASTRDRVDGKGEENGEEEGMNMIGACVKYLMENEFILLRNVQTSGITEERYIASQLGSAVLSSSLGPGEGLLVLAELCKARQCFVLENELHIVYLVTPLSGQQWPGLSWYQYMCLWERLSAASRRVADLVGVSEQFIARAVRTGGTMTTAQQHRSLAVHTRFYTALALHDLVNEVPLARVARTYGCARGTLQSLQRSAATFAGMVTVFCQKLGWLSLELLLAQFQSRLTFGVQRELIPLVRISLLNAQRARVLYDAGYDTLATLANADAAIVETLLRKAVPFQSKKRGEEESEWEAEKRRQARCIWLTGQRGLTEREAAEMIIHEANTLIWQDMGVQKPNQPARNGADGSNTTAQLVKMALQKRPRRKRTSTGRINASKNPKKTPTRPNTSRRSFTDPAQVSVLSPPPSYQRSATKEKPTSTRSIAKASNSVVSQKREASPRGTLAVASPQRKRCRSNVEKNDCALPGVSTVKNSDDVVKKMNGNIIDVLPTIQMRATNSLREPVELQSKPSADNPTASCSVVITGKLTTAALVPKKRLGSCVAVKQTASNKVLSSTNVHLKSVVVVQQQPLKQQPLKQQPIHQQQQQSEERQQPIKPDQLYQQQKQQLAQKQQSNIGEIASSRLQNGLNCDNQSKSSDTETEGINCPLFKSASSMLTTESSSEVKPPVTTPDIVVSHAEDCEVVASKERSETPPLFSEGIVGDLDRDSFMESFVLDAEMNNLLMGKFSPKCASMWKPGEEIVCSTPQGVLMVGRNDIEEISNGVVDQAECEIEDPVMAAITEVTNQRIAQVDNLIDNVIHDNPDYPPGDCDVKNDGANDVLVTSLNKRVAFCDDESAEDLFDHDSHGSMDRRRRLSAELCGSPLLLPTSNYGKDMPDANVGGLTEHGDEGVGSYEGFEEDMDIAMNMSDTFMCTGQQVNWKPAANCEVLPQGTTNIDGVVTPIKPFPKDKDGALSAEIKTTPDQNNDSGFIPPTPPSASVTRGPDTPSRLVGGLVHTPKDQGSAHVKGDSSKVCRRLPTQTSTDTTTKDTSIADQSYSDDCFRIIDVAANRRLFEHFIAEWKTKTRFSLCLACEKKPAAPPVEVNRIGAKFSKAKAQKRSKKTQHLPTANGIVMPDTDLMVVGLSVTWEKKDAYFISFTESPASTDLNERQPEPPADHALPLSERLACIRSILQSTTTESCDKTIVMFAAREQYRLLSQGCAILCGAVWCVHDPKVADWLLDPGACERNLHAMVGRYLPLDVHMLSNLGGGIGVGSLGLSPDNPGSTRIRATLETILVLKLMDTIYPLLREVDMYRVFSEVEMSVSLVIARMEMNGMGFDEAECIRQKTLIEMKLSALENRAYELAGHSFSLSSTDDIAQVLFNELGLPPNGGAPTVHHRGRPTARRAHSTAKPVLERLRVHHPLPAVLIEWRRLGTTLAKLVCPLRHSARDAPRLAMRRVYAVADTHTATGRVTMHEPCVQNVPRDFDVLMPAVIGESPPAETHSVRGLATRGRRGRPTRFSMPVNQMLDDSSVPTVAISMRHAFVPFQGGVLVAADYSQLELRIIAHLARDRRLIKVLNEGGDVFKMIASQWRGVAPEDVTTTQRQQAKQVCYGMIYGIGAKALAEQLSVEEDEATVFIESFKSRYTGMHNFLRKTVKNCRENGYVKTILDRRRYLPAISSTNSHAKAHAERQAVNTCVQGSAADLVKTAMVHIDHQLSAMFPDTSAVPHTHDLTGQLAAPGPKPSSPVGAYLILQLHDELIYEVHASRVHQVAAVVKQCMEAAIRLSVCLPVKVSTGPTWASLCEMDM